jgi:ADP-ribose pyrophosphatase
MSSSDPAAALPPSPLARAWARGSARALLSTRVFDVHGVTFSHPARGTEREFIVVQAPDWVNVIATTPAGELVLVQQFRFGINTFSLEVPGGVMEAGEDPVAAGVRELAEETGFVGRNARLLGTVHPNPAIQANRCHFVWVEQAVRERALAWDADEEIDLVIATPAEVQQWAQTGLITHGLTLNALFMFAAR